MSERVLGKRYGLASVIAAAGLGQTTADQVTDRQQGDQEPALVGAEPLTVLVDIDHQRGDQDTQDRQYVDDEFGGLERGLGLPGETAVAIPGLNSAAAAGLDIMVGGAGGHTSPFGGCLWLGRFGASRGIPNKDSLGHFHAFRGFQLIGSDASARPEITTD